MLVRLRTRDDPGVRRTTGPVWNSQGLSEHAALRNGNNSPDSAIDDCSSSAREIQPQMPGPALGRADGGTLQSLDQSQEN